MFAHEVGHNLNALHDEKTKKCNKADKKHIMAEEGGKKSPFSKCSIQAIHLEIDKLRVKEELKDSLHKCLKNLPFKENSYDDLVISETRDG